MDTQTLSNFEIEQNLLKFVKQERKLLHLILLHIKEVDQRRIFLGKGHSSLFEYLVKDLGYSNAAAQRRIEGSRLLREIPEIADKIKDGSLHLGHVGEIAKAVKQKEFESKSKVSTHEKKCLLKAIEQKTISQTQQILSSRLDIQLRIPEKKVIQKDESVHLQITLSKEQYARLQECRNLASHILLKQGDLGLSNLIDLLSGDYLKKHQSRSGSRNTLHRHRTEMSPRMESKKHRNSEFTSGRESSSLSLMSCSNPESPEVSPNPVPKIPADNPSLINPLSNFRTSESEVTRRPNKTLTTKTRMDVRSLYRECQHVDPRNRQKCRNKFLLEVDHKIPRWAGGSHEIVNLTLLCSAHNKAKYRREAGLN